LALRQGGWRRVLVDLRTLLPYDEPTVLASVRKCSKGLGGILSKRVIGPSVHLEMQWRDLQMARRSAGPTN
jgi:hypothetical protein